VGDGIDDGVGDGVGFEKADTAIDADGFGGGVFFLAMAKMTLRTVQTTHAIA
jgi:hypothetical protein